MATLRADVLASLTEDATARVFAAGAMMVPATREPGHMAHVPFALLPRRVPRAAYTQAVALAEPFNRLVHAISKDPAWLIGVLERAGCGDDFTRRLLDMYKTVLAEGIRQPVVLGVHRSDYMVDRGGNGSAPPVLRQVELNTISSGFAALALRVAETHRYMVANYAPRHAALAGYIAASTPDDVPSIIAHAMPASSSLEAVPAAMAAAHGLYGVPTAVVAFVVQRRERNVMDQRQIEQALFSRHGVRVRRVTHAFVGRYGRLRATDAALLLPREGALPLDAIDASAIPDADMDEVSLLYFRSGYSPSDYEGEVDWAARLMMERSRAVKCPSVAYHLAGAKKVQQALAAPGAVERFLPPEEAVQVRACFAGLWSLDPAEADDATAAAIADAIARPAEYVVKPQREGGGNNLYGDAVRAALSGGMSNSELCAHILMGRIHPRPDDCVLVKDGAATVQACVSELGIFSVHLAEGDTVHMSASAGFLLRTKSAHVDEGGVAAGFAVIDSPLLVDGDAAA